MSMKKFLIVFLVLAALAASVFSLYFYSQYQRARQQLQNRTIVAGEENKKLLSQVGKLMFLPEGEEPTIATVSDKEKLKDQPFFAKASNGDKLIIYTQAKKAILYDPAANKIIDIVNLSLAMPSAAVQSPIRLALYNGTQTIGLTENVEANLKDKISEFEVPVRENASKRDYTKTLVIDISGNRKELASEIAKILEGEGTTLPEGETKPEAEILVIVGSEYTK